MTRESETNTTSTGLPRAFENPITGEKVTFLVTAEETRGEYARVRCDVPAGVQGPPLHYHLGYTESFEVVEGRLDMCVGSKENHVVLEEGQSAFVPPGVPHRFWNPSDEPVVFDAEVRPPQAWVKAGQAMRGLAADGKLNDKGIPKNLFELALIFQLSDIYMTGLALFLQKAIFGTMARMARWRGYDPEFSRYTKPKGA